MSARGDLADTFVGQVKVIDCGPRRIHGEIQITWRVRCGACERAIVIRTTAQINTAIGAGARILCDDCGAGAHRARRARTFADSTERAVSAKNRTTT